VGDFHEKSSRRRRKSGSNEDDNERRNGGGDSFSLTNGEVHQVDENAPGRPQSSSSNDPELKRLSYESSKLLVAKAEKTLSIAMSLENTKEELRKARAENEQLRILLLEGINGAGKDDFKRYANIPLIQLLRMRLEELEDNRIDSSSANSSFFSVKKTSRGLCSGGYPTSNPIGQSKHKKHERSSPIKEKDDCASCAHLKNELEKMADRSRRDREIKNKLIRNVEDSKSEVNNLLECMEKLNLNLKHEASAKAKALNERVKIQRELEMVKQRNQIFEKKNEQQDKAICNLNENSEHLRDQLHQMEKKCTELRNKLDWTRAQMEKSIRKKDEEMKDLRLQKFSAEKHAKQQGTQSNTSRKVNDEKLESLSRKRRALRGIYASEVWRLLPSTADEIT
jgi:myosin heavy subunit